MYCMAMSYFFSQIRLIISERAVFTVRTLDKVTVIDTIFIYGYRGMIDCLKVVSVCN